MQSNRGNDANNCRDGWRGGGASTV